MSKPGKIRTILSVAACKGTRALLRRTGRGGTAVPGDVAMKFARNILEAVSEGMEIVVKRVSYKEEKETVEIDFETKKEDDSSLEKGTEKVKTEGVKGEKTVESRIKLVDGKEESREVIKEEITKEPVDEIILVGTKEKPAGKQVVSKVAVPNCADGSHGYYEIHYSDGSVEYVEY